jgi:tetratricopeptide (TPR) repeat protein
MMFPTIIECYEHTQKVEDSLKKDSNIINAEKNNKLGCMLMQINSSAKAIPYFAKAIQLFDEVSKKNKFTIRYSNALYNMANTYSQLGKQADAFNYYTQAYQSSPFSKVVEYNMEAATQLENMPELKYSSYSSFICTITNMSVLLSRDGKDDEAEKYCRLVLKASKSCRHEATINLGAIMRKKGEYKKAMDFAWAEIEALCNKADKKYVQPSIIDVGKLPKISEYKALSVVCVKYGTKYGSDYVNKLYHGVQKNLTCPHKFICYTEDPSGLDKEIEIAPLQKGFDGWWNKASIFNNCFPEGTKVIYIDLDMIIVGNINYLADSPYAFATLSTKDLHCELAQEGYNSSIIVYSPPLFQEICDFLKNYYSEVTKVLVRFDYYLEMMIKNSALLQDVFPNKIVDYVMKCTKSLPVGSTIVCFPRTPKPHQLNDPWILQNWK